MPWYANHAVFVLRQVTLEHMFKNIKIGPLHYETIPSITWQKS